MMFKRIRNIAVIGAGTMGSGIAHLFGLHDYEVTLVDSEEGQLRKAKEKIGEQEEPEQRFKMFELINFSTEIEKAGRCDIAIEAVFENETVKKEVLKTLSRICDEQAVIATNSSSISINSLAEAVKNPGRFIGMHFMNPPVIMPLVEVIKGSHTSPETVKTVVFLAKKLDKIPAVVNDAPGFVSNRLLFALIGEAMRLLENGVASKENIDAVMCHGMHHPMGPITLADFIGLDICRNIMAYLHEKLADEKYRPPRILENLVKKGKLGRKTGEGFYRYG